MTQITKAQFDAPLAAPMRSNFKRSASAVPASAAKALTAALGNEHVLLDDLELRTVHSRGGYFSYHVPSNTRLVDGVLRPGTIEEVQAIVRLCAKHKLCLIPRGGGTNVSMTELPRYFCVRLCPGGGGGGGGGGGATLVAMVCLTVPVAQCFCITARHGTRCQTCWRCLPTRRAQSSPWT